MRREPMRLASWSWGGRDHAGTVSADGREVTPIALADPSRGALPLIQMLARGEPLPSPARGEVAFENVAFAYPTRPDEPVLNSIDFRVAPGEVVAIVGPSGAGKSTLFQLIERFYDPSAGRVTLDGVDIAKADPKAVRGEIALVPQDAFVFGASVADMAAILDACGVGHAGADLGRHRDLRRGAHAGGDQTLDALRIVERCRAGAALERALGRATEVQVDQRGARFDGAARRIGEHAGLGAHELECDRSAVASTPSLRSSQTK